MLRNHSLGYFVLEIEIVQAWLEAFQPCGPKQSFVAH